MNQDVYRTLETFMRAEMPDADCAHGSEHVMRVLYAALDIAEHEPCGNRDVLIAACLLHDIGRQAQNENPALCHAKVGAARAYDYLLDLGWSGQDAAHVRDCIITHRFRADNPPATIEAKILFDADKLDVCGAIGIARTLLYQAQHDHPLYRRKPDGVLSDGRGDSAPSFFREYRFKLERLYDRFYTRRGAELAQPRREAAFAYFDALLAETLGADADGQARLRTWIE